MFPHFGWAYPAGILFTQQALKQTLSPLKPAPRPQGSLSPLWAGYPLRGWAAVTSQISSVSLPRDSCSSQGRKSAETAEVELASPGAPLTLEAGRLPVSLSGPAMLRACGQLPPGPKIGLSWARPLEAALRPLGQTQGYQGRVGPVWNPPQAVWKDKREPAGPLRKPLASVRPRKPVFHTRNQKPYE